jgi:hypothetical protein
LASNHSIKRSGRGRRRKWEGEGEGAGRREEAPNNKGMERENYQVKNSPVEGGVCFQEVNQKPSMSPSYIDYVLMVFEYVGRGECYCI